jgi:hypothetical protein
MALITRGLFRIKNYLFSTATIDNDFFFATLETAEIIILEITFLY